METNRRNQGKPRGVVIPNGAEGPVRDPTKRVKWHKRRRVPSRLRAAEAVLSTAVMAEIVVRSLTRLRRVRDDKPLVMVQFKPHHLSTASRPKRLKAPPSRHSRSCRRSFSPLRKISKQRNPRQNHQHSISRIRPVVGERITQKRRRHDHENGRDKRISPRPIRTLHPRLAHPEHKQRAPRNHVKQPLRKNRQRKKLLEIRPQQQQRIDNTACTTIAADGV